jgi:hypothetical protein
MSEKENTPDKKKKRMSAQAIVSIIIICLLIAIPAGIYFWKQGEISKLKKQHETEISNIKADAGKTIADNNKKSIETITRVFAWAVRSEMLRNNMEQVNTYMNDLVKTADLNDISAIKTDGIVILSTNKKYEGNAYPGFVASELNNINEVVSRDDAGGNIMSICPIMGLDNKMGTIVITYKPKTYTFGNNE